MDLEHVKKRFFTEDHMRTMSTLAAQLAIAIENATLYERVTKQEQRLERDLMLARELQFRLLPACCPVSVVPNSRPSLCRHRPSATSTTSWNIPPTTTAAQSVSAWPSAT